MKLRLIFLVLSLLAFLSAATGGYLYYVSLKKSAFAEAERQAVNRVEIIQKNLSAFLAENVRPVRVLAGMPALAEILSAEDHNAAAVETLLDETAAGLTPTEVDEAIELIKKIRKNGVSILIIEHIMKVIMTMSDRIHAINFGQTIAAGTPEEVANNPAVIEAYLGEDYAKG